MRYLSFFISNIMHAVQAKTSMGPHLFNMFFFVVFTLCICLSQLQLLRRRDDSLGDGIEIRTHHQRAQA